VKLNCKGSALVKRLHKLNGTVVVTQKNAAGQTQTISQRELTIKARKHKHKK
jgi:hypothetical protein